MTTKADLPLLGRLMVNLGRELVAGEGATAWDRSTDWADPLRAPTAATSDEPCACGHSPEAHHRESKGCTYVARTLHPLSGDLQIHPCPCMTYRPAPSDTGAQDRRAEAKDAGKTTTVAAEYRQSLAQLETALMVTMKLHRVICPPQPGKGRHDPETAAEVALDGYCKNCWRNDQQMVPITIDRRTGKPIFIDHCEWCGRMNGLHGMYPDLPILQLRHAGRHVTSKHWDEALRRHAAAQPTKKGKKAKRKGGRIAA